jgi:UTP--glucose-1-phosphate uridylyltransferase
MKPVRKAVIPAAGLGTRFLPATKSQPKEMLPIVDKPTIQYIVEEAVASGIEDIIIVTGRGKRAIEDYFDRSIEMEATLQKKGNRELLRLVREISDLVDIHYVRQKEPLGLGHAVWCARKFIGDEPFAVLLGDDVIDARTPCLKQMLKVYERYGGTILGVQEVSISQVHRYGIVKPVPVAANLFRVENLVEKPKPDKAPSTLAVLGRYIIQPEVFDILAGLPAGAGGEIQLTDALKILALKQSVYAYVFEGRRYDVGDRLGFLQATVEFALKREDLREPFREYLTGLVSRLPSVLEPGA